MNKNNPTCKKCKSKNTIKAGKKPTIHGLQQKYQCKDCGTIYTEEDP